MALKNIITEEEMLAIPAREVSATDKLPAKPLVSVLMVTYNHEKFIEEAIKGVLAQKTGFNIELIIGEDLSTDNTLAICFDYQRQYPERIRIVAWNKNIGSVGNLFRILCRAKGKYIALCDGDDYWTDPAKLSKQIAILEKFPDATLCGAIARVEDRVRMTTGPMIKPRVKKNSYDLTDAIRENLFQTSTMVLQKSALRFHRSAFNIVFLDRYMRVVCARSGPLRFLPEVVSAYRRHSGGVWGSASLRVKIKNYRELQHGIIALVGKTQPGLARIRLKLASLECELLMSEGRVLRARSLVGCLMTPRFYRTGYVMISLLLLRVYLPGCYQYGRFLWNQCRQWCQLDSGIN